MKMKDKTRILIPVAVLFSLFYILFAFRPLTTELHLSPNWTIDIAQIKDKTDKDELIPFRLGQNIGYFTDDGRVVSSITFPFKASISDSWYALYGADNISTPFFHADGTAAGTLNQYGFPFFDDDRIYIFLPGGASFAQYDSYGNRLWQYEHYSPITSFDSSKGGTVVGYADGTITSFTKEGRISQEFAPGGSDYPVILGTGISHSGSMIACVSGHNKQRFVLAKKDDEHTKIIFHQYLDKEQAKQVFVKFSKNDNLVFFDDNGSLGVVDVKKLKLQCIPLEGSIIQIEESDIDSIVFVLSRYGRTYTVTAIEPQNHPAGSFSFNAGSAFIQVRGNKLYVGKDNKISSLTISRK